MNSRWARWKGTQARRWLALSLLATWGLLLGMPWRLWAQEPSGWSPPVNLSESYTRSYYPDVAVDSAGHVYVVWGEYSSDDEGRPDMLMFQMWDGQTWSPPNDIAFQGHLPQIAVDSQGRLHLVRIVGHSLVYNGAWAQAGPSNAQAWTPDQDIGIGDPYWPHMIVDSQDRIHVAFTDVAEGSIHYTRSIDRGESWSDPIQLDTLVVDAETPRLAVDRLDNVYATWQVWGPSVAGEQPSAKAVGFSVSTDGGETWSHPREIVAGEIGYEYPQAAVDSLGIIHVVWYYRWEDLRSSIGYVTSSDGGESWSEVEQLNLGPVGAYSFGLAVDSADNLHLVIPLKWGGLPMGVSHLTHPPGGRWSPPTRISQHPCNAASADAELVISGGNHLHVVWYDRLECELGWIGPSGRGEVFYSDFVSDAPHIASRPLSLMPTATATATLVPIPGEPSPTPTATTAPWRSERGGDDAATQPVRSPIALGIGMSIGLTTVVAFLWSIARHSHRYR